jgi:putative heme-binding domain-containing protein
VAEHYARGSDQSPGALIAALLHADQKVLETIVAGLAKGWSKDNTIALAKDAETALTELLKKSPPKTRADLLKLATAMGSKTFEKQAVEIAKAMLATALDEKQSDSDRVAGIRQVVGIGAADTTTIDKLLATITPQSSPQFTAGVIDALGSSDSSAVAPALVKRYSTLPPSGRAAVIRAMLGRIESTRVLLDALGNGKIPLGDLALDQRQALASHANGRIAGRARAILARGGGLPDPDRQKVIDQFLSVTKKTGDADAGKLVFKNNCAKCHRHSGEGEQIGPDLTGVAVHTKEHLLVDILDPSRNVEGNFRIYRVEMKDGRSISGLLAAETRTSIELIDSEAKRHQLQRSEIEELQASNKSLMPEGFEKTVKPEDLTNLLEFLTKRGKYLPIPLDKVASIVSTKGMFFNEDANVERLVFRDWSPKTFEGVPFYLVDPKEGKVPNAVMLFCAQGRFPPTMPKSVKLTCNSAAKAIHFLSGVSGWGYPYSEKGSVSMIVRLHYADGITEDHQLKNGEQFADYIRRVDVPGSKFAFALRGQQIRYFAVTPKRDANISEIELVKGPDNTAPVVMAVTVETR